MSSSTVTDGESSGAVTGTGAMVGGLAGSAINNSAIEGAQASGAASGDGTQVGGLVGTVANSTISNSVASGRVSGNADLVGGLAGYLASDSSVVDSHATGQVSGVNFVGGLVGLTVQASDVQRTYASGDVSGGGAVGGLVGAVNTVYSAAIGAAIYDDPTEDVTIEQSFALGAVDASGNYVGGLAGLTFNALVQRNFATGAVAGGLYVGGLVGDANLGTRINVNFAASEVSGTGSVGALVGYTDTVEYHVNYYANDLGTVDGFGTIHNASGFELTDVIGASLAQLQCPTAATDTACAGPATLYDGWQDTDWDFGSNLQLPGLTIDTTVYRDGNADGVLD